MGWIDLQTGESSGAEFVFILGALGKKKLAGKSLSICFCHDELQKITFLSSAVGEKYIGCKQITAW